MVVSISRRIGPVPWDEDTEQRVKKRLLDGDRIKDIAQDEGLTLKQLSSTFFKKVGEYPRAWAIKKNPDLLQRHSLLSSRALPVNERYFDDFLEKPTEHTAYVFGILYGRQTLCQQDQVRFNSKNETLIDIVKTELEARHKLIGATNGGTCELHVRGVPHLYHTLQSLGLDKPIRERPFPDLSDDVLSDFIRGIVEANAGVAQQPGYYSRIVFVRFGYAFLASMHNHLQQHAGVSGNGPIGLHLSYMGSNANKVRDFIYHGVKYLEDTGLFVPEIRQILESGKDSARPRTPPEDFSPIEAMLKSGAQVQEVAGQLGCSADSFRRMFRKQYGASPRVWLREQDL